MSVSPIPADGVCPECGGPDVGYDSDIGQVNCPRCLTVFTDDIPVATAEEEAAFWRASRERRAAADAARARRAAIG